MAFTWTYNNSGINSPYSITINTASTPDGGPYLATSASGSVNGVAITGVAPIGLGFNGASDNLLYVSSTDYGSLDSGGCGFSLADGTYAKIDNFSSSFVLVIYNSSKQATSIYQNPPDTYTSGTACFLRGTRLRTTEGDVAVESLRAGDLVITASGATAPIVWIGHRAMDAGDVAHHPIRLGADSFGTGLPMRDLYLSPDHAVLTDGVLVPAKHLVNGCSIARVAVAEITYFHVLLARHDVILSEGLPTESFLDDDNIAQFDNAGEAPAMAPYMEPCAPRITQGVRLEAIRSRLEAMLRVAVPA